MILTNWRNSYCRKRGDFVKRPKGCIYPDCLNCTFDDCIYDGLELEDIVESDNRDLEARMFKNPQYLTIMENRKKYEHSEKAKLRKARYERSEKARLRRKRYYERHRDEILEKRKTKRMGEYEGNF